MNITNQLKKHSRALRNLVWEQHSVMALFKKDASLISQLRDVRADQYGIRTSIGLVPHVIKFKIVLEGRIKFDTPATADEICGVTTLGVVDMAASKPLANSDRWADEGVLNRDVIDLAMMNQPVHVLHSAIAKAELAYRPAVQTDLHKAVDKLLEKPDWLERLHAHPENQHHHASTNGCCTLCAEGGDLIHR